MCSSKQFGCSCLHLELHDFCQRQLHPPPSGLRLSKLEPKGPLQLCLLQVVESEKKTEQAGAHLIHEQLLRLVQMQNSHFEHHVQLPMDPREQHQESQQNLGAPIET